MSSNNRLHLVALLLVVCSLFVNQNECRPSSHKYRTREDPEQLDVPRRQQSEDGLTQQDLLNNGMNIDETQAIPVLIEVPDGASNNKESSETDQNTDNDQSPTSSDNAGVDETELASAESGPMAQYHNGPMTDLRASASEY